MSTVEVKSAFEGVREVEVGPLLKSMVLAVKPLAVWTDHPRARWSSRVQSVHENSGAWWVTIPVDTLGRTFLETSRNAGTEDFFFSVQVPTDFLFFKATLRRLEDSIAQFRVKIPVYKAQRRLSLRVPFIESEAPRASFQAATKDGVKILDAVISNVSAGGVGFLIHSAQSDSGLKSAIQSGVKLDHFRFSIGDKTFTLQANIIHVSRLSRGLTPYSLKIGAEWINASEEDLEWISRFAVETSVRFLGGV